MNRIFMVTIIVMSVCFAYAKGIDGSTNLKLFFIEITTQGCEDINTDYYIYDITTGEKIKKFREEQISSSGPPMISEDGNCILYYYEENSNKFIRLLNINKNMLVINKQVSFTVYGKNFNRDYIALSGATSRYAESSEIYLINIENMELKRITNNNIMDYDPVISPNNNALIFLQKNKELTKTYLKEYSFNSKEIRTIHMFEGTGYYLFQWLRNDKALLTKRDKYGTPFLLDLESGKAVEFNLDNVSKITISPDGRKIAYLRGREDAGYNLDLYISNIDGSNVETIKVDDNVDIVAPQWLIK